MLYLILIICILSSGFAGNIYKKLADESPRADSSAVMPALWFAALGIMFTVMGSIAGFSAAHIPAAVASGASIAVTAIILIESMKSNAISVSVIIMNMNFIIPVILSAIFLHERASVIQLVGILASIAVIIIINIGGGGGNAKKSSILLPLIACVGNGLFNFFIKLNADAKGDPNTFFAISFFSAAVFAVGAAFVLARGSSPLRGVKSGAILPFLALMALCNGVCFYTEALLANMMNAAAQFTIVTSASIFLSLAIGFIFQGDKFTKKSAISIIFCLVAIVCQLGGIA